MWNKRWMMLLTLGAMAFLIGSALVLSGCQCEECDCDDDSVGDDDDNTDDDDDSAGDDDDIGPDDDDSLPECGAAEVCEYEVNTCMSGEAMPDCLNRYSGPGACPGGNVNIYLSCLCDCVDTVPSCENYNTCATDCYAANCPG